jgi:hypothetical protein
MSTLANKIKVKSVKRDGQYLVLDLGDSKRIDVPLKAFPRLQHATDADLQDYRLSGAGTGIHWPVIDEDLSFEWLIQDYGIKIDA